MNVQCCNCFENYDSDLGMCPHCGYTKGDKAKESAHMNPGTVVNNRYHIGRVLGFGGFGVTYLAWDEVLAAKVAIKEYLPSEFSTRTEGNLKVSVFTDEREKQYYAGLVKFMDEAKRVAKFHGESGIVGVSDAFMENNTAYMVMELLEGETLKSFLKREGVMSVDAAIGLLTPVIQSLKVVHEAGIIHRDIAPDNIMITKSGDVKLIDFGAARYAAAPKKTIIVKPGFSPLEQYQSKLEQGSYTDVFALASVLYYMITGVMPGDSLERQASIEKGMKDPLQAPSAYVKDISPNVETAILNALNLRAKDRTQDMETFFNELTGPETVKRKAEKTKKIDALKWPLWAKIAVPVGGIAVITALVLFFTGVIGFSSGLQTKITIPDGMARVPSVVNDDSDTAETKLTEAKLSYLISGRSYSEVIDSDYVLTQDTLSGTVVMENSVVGVTISKGVETSFVEDVTLMNEAEAISVLENAGFEVVVNTEYSRTVAEGSVIDQSVQKDTELKTGSIITLIVSAGSRVTEHNMDKSTPVPDFSGMTYEEALEAAENAGVVLAIAEKTYTNEDEADTVLNQSVVAGDEVAFGTVIELSASWGEEYVRTEDVQYETEEKAVEELEGLDVHIEYQECDTVEEGLVISQSIEAGEKVDPDEEITIIVSTGPSKFEMPDVTDEKLDDVQQMLIDEGLVVYISYEQDKSEKEGIILEQSIEAGEEVSAGTEVTLTVSTKKEDINVEDVVGETVKEAKELLTEQGFNVLFSDVNGEEITADVDEEMIVIYQLPLAGSGQKAGTTIVLTVADEETLAANNVSMGKGIAVGTVLDENGDPLSDVDITITAEDSDGSYDGNAVKTVTTAEDGSFEIYMSAGRYCLTFEKSHYLETYVYYEAVSDETEYIGDVTLFDDSWADEEDQTVYGNVTNALNGQAVEEATIKIRKGWNNTTGSYEADLFASRSATTDEMGDYTVSLPVGAYTAEISKDDYVTTYVNILSSPYEGTQYSTITPVLDDDEYRIVLTWGEEPYDLDAHLICSVEDTTYEIYYMDQTFYYDDELVAALDWDDTDSYGPETITISWGEDSGDFTYYVFDYTNGSGYYYGEESSDSMALANSSAQVLVYKGNSLIKSYSVPLGQSGTRWDVFMIKDGELITINTIS